MAGDRRATAGYTIASRRIEKVFPADDYSGVAIAGAAGPAVEHGAALPGAARALREDRGRARSRSRARPTSSPQMVRANLPAAMQGFVVVPLFAGFDERRDRGRVFSYDATGGRYEETDFQTNGSGGVHARNWIKAQWREDDRAATRPSTSRSARCSRPPTRTPRRVDPISCGASSRRSRTSTRGLPARSTTTRSNAASAEAVLGRPRGGSGPDEHALLRLARAGDEGPGRLRPEGHRPGSQPRRASAPPTAS